MNFNEQDIKKLKSLIRQLIREELCDRSIISEMAFPREAYVTRIENFLPQIVQNLSLIFFRIETNDETTKNHWKRELKSLMMQVLAINIKGNNKPKARMKAISQALDEMDALKENTIRLWILTKFEDENIDINSPFMAKVYYDVRNELVFLMEFVANIDETGLSNEINAL